MVCEVNSKLQLCVRLYLSLMIQAIALSSLGYVLTTLSFWMVPWSITRPTKVGIWPQALLPLYLQYFLREIYRMQATIREKKIPIKNYPPTSLENYRRRNHSKELLSILQNAKITPPIHSNLLVRIRLYVLARPQTQVRRDSLPLKGILAELLPHQPVPNALLCPKKSLV